VWSVGFGGAATGLQLPPLQLPLMSYCQVVEVPGQIVDAAFR